MGSNTLRKRCPRCKRLRKWTVPPDHRAPEGFFWVWRDGQWVCCWCVARETPDGEAKLRMLHRELRQIRKEQRKERQNR